LPFGRHKQIHVDLSLIGLQPGWRFDCIPPS
jgi:hypothetical protein